MKFVFFGGIVFFVGSIILIFSNFKDLKVETNGSVVKMRIERLPYSCLGTKINHFVGLSYQGRYYSKKIGGQFCDEHHIGELIDIKFLEGSSTILFPAESVKTNLFAFALLGLVGAGMSLSQWKKIKNEK